MNNTECCRRLTTRRKLVATLCGSSLISATGCLSFNSDKNSQTPQTNSEETQKEPPRIGLGADTFERFSGLEVVDGRLSPDTERHVTGTQCAALETGADGAWLHISLDEPMDFSNARLSCYLATDGTSAGKYLYANLSDKDGNRFRTRTVIRSHGELIQVDFAIVNPQVDNVAVDLENITRVSFRPGPRDQSGNEVVYLDSPNRVVAPDTAKVVFQFDDGNKTDYTEGLPYLSQYDYPAITYVNTNTIGDTGKLDQRQLQELKEKGWLIGSHTADHVDLKKLSDTAEIERQVRDAQEWLVDHGFTEGARHFAYPYNRIDEQALSVVSRFHDTGRVWGWQPIARPSNLQVIPGEGDPTPTKIREVLDQVIQYGGVVSIWYHSLSKDESLRNFKAVVDEVRERERVGDVDVIRHDELESLASSTKQSVL